MDQPTMQTPSPKVVAAARIRRINRQAALIRLAERDHANDHVDTVAVTAYSSRAGR